MLTDVNGEPSMDLEGLIRSGLIDTYYAPVVEVASGKVAAYRVQQSVRDDDSGADPDIAGLRAAVRDSDMVGDFDASLRAMALRDAESAGIPSTTRLVLITEPESLVALEDRTHEPDRSVILSLNAGRIAAKPATVLRSVRQARSLGWGIGMSDVGATLESAAFLPLVNPSLVTLHKDVVRTTDMDYLAELIRLLHAHVERTGAVILAKGVETEDDMDVVRAIGARFVTGPMFGEAVQDVKPAEELGEDPLHEHFSRNQLAQGTPYSIAQGLKRDPLIMDKALLVAEMSSLQRRALTSGAASVVIGVFGDIAEVSEETREVFAVLNERLGFTAAVFGNEEGAELDGIPGARLDASDPIRSEYAIVVIGPDWSGMVAADRRVDPGSDGRTEYDVYVTTERYTCVDGARSVLTRISSSA